MTTAIELLARYGSPLYVYRLELLDEALLDLRDALPASATLYYSVKANPVSEVIRRLAGSGCKAEISSNGELAAVQAAGLPGCQCLYTGPGKTPGELVTAITAGVRLFSCESLSDLRRVGAAAETVGAEVECLLRINNLGRGSGTGAFRMTGRRSQFGIDLAQLAAERDELLSVAGTRITGLHFFPVSNARDESSLAEEFLASIEVAAKLDVPLSRLNLGGGFPAPFAAPAPRQRFTFLRASLEAALDDLLPQWRVGAPEIMFESGRYLVSDCGSLICTVMDLKLADNGVFAIVDSGINHLGGMAGLGRLARPAATPEGTGHGDVGTITGPLCTPADVLGRNVPLGELRSGQVVTFPNVGAYGLTASLVAFLGRPAPTEVVCESGRVLSASRLEVVRTSLGGAER